MWYRLCVDVDTLGQVQGISWERHHIDGDMDRIHAWPTVDYRTSIGDAIDLCWQDVRALDGVLDYAPSVTR